MKQLTLLLAFLVLNIAFAKANSEKPTTPVQSNISEVTVYLSGAQITRTANINLQNGTTTVVLENLSPVIDENSIQISGLKDAAILSIKYGLDYLSVPKFPKKVEELKAQRKSLTLQLSRLNSKIDGLKKEEDILNTNKRLGSETVEIDIEKVKAMASYYGSRLTEIRNAIIDTEIEKETLRKDVKNIDKQFKEFNVSDETQKGIITLKLNSSIATDLDIKVSYTVSEAGWFPMYAYVQIQ